MPWHSETKPSFIVWAGSGQDYENFYCFGCQCKHNIIHLVAQMESIPARQAIEKLSDGVEFSIIDEQKLEQDIILNEDIVLGTKKAKSPTADISKSLIEMSDICHLFLKGVDRDFEGQKTKKEQERIDGIWTLVDGLLRDYEFDEIESLKQHVGPMLLKQRKVLLSHYKNSLKEQYEKNEGG